MPEFFFPYFKNQYTAYINDFNGKSCDTIPAEYPSELKNAFEEIESLDLKFYKNFWKFPNNFYKKKCINLKKNVHHGSKHLKLYRKEIKY